MSDALPTREAGIVHPCCGCSCEHCAQSHGTGGPHTEVCLARFWKEQGE
jgi:hypothetical protein